MDRVLDPVRHANILRAIMNVDLRNDRIEAIVPVMVAFDENKLTVQPLLRPDDISLLHLLSRL